MGLHMPLMISLACLSVLLAPAAGGVDEGQCSELLLRFQAHQAELDARSAAPVPGAPPPLFFLHVPRTAGKAYYSCFLKPAFEPSRRCFVSYDELRLNASAAQCELLVSHDDYSALQVRRRGWVGCDALRAGRANVHRCLWRVEAQRMRGGWAGAAARVLSSQPPRRGGTPPHPALPPSTPRRRCGRARTC